MSVAGLLLAAGAGRRRGGPKALAHDQDGTSWLRRGLAVLRDGGCADVTVVLGAAAEEARAVLGADPAGVVVAEDWDEGMGASLRAGLAALAAGAVDGSAADAALVLLVDLPDVGADVVARLVAAVEGPGALARAAYDGEPGHPVVLGRDHWAGVVATARGDRGARDYLRAHPPVLVECGDLATGDDVDGPA